MTRRTPLARRGARTLVWIAALLLLAPGCRLVRYKLGIGVTVERPDEGTPFALVQQVLAAGLEPEDDKAWERFVATLHSQERGGQGSMTTCRRTFWPSFRRKAAFLVEDKATLSFTVLDERASEQGHYLKVFVKNKASELPTPINVKQDPLAGNAWRLAACSI